MTKLPPSLVRVRQEWQWIRTMPRRICPSLGRVEVAKPRSRFNASMPKLVRQIPRNLSSQYGPLPNPKYPPLKFAFSIVSPIGVYVIVPRQRHPNPLYSTPRILAPGFRRLQGFVVKACSDYERRSQCDSEWRTRYLGPLTKPIREREPVPNSPDTHKFARAYSKSSAQRFLGVRGWVSAGTRGTAARCCS